MVNSSVPVTPLKLARVRAGLRSIDVALAAGLSPSAYSQLEYGRARVSASVADRLSRILKTPVEALFEERESRR